MYRYNEQYKVLFQFDPIMQAVVGKFKGYMLVMDAITNSRLYQDGDQVEFVYTQNKWNKLVKHISKYLNNRTTKN